ncbi:hypothetical protein GCG54_00004769 [Colletotrichum gloeosporioides]|uniref:C2H2-type domain-containing protein n=1 Tax=Colletotrichum gloeosporioides TaxID=474922 RepID=A0A8H4FIL5_COLGL|nr:uncharacterized protein GCG54_00004769 [Colletotrichum gloeosporioides]KAF3803597.1 hypothetical protein GCG54_00004769 [Colletotrichum gloeosporioides]
MDGLGNHGIHEHLGLRGETQEYFQLQMEQHQHAQHFQGHAHNHLHGLVNDTFLPSYHDDTCLDLAPGHTHTHGPTKSHQQTMNQAHHGRSMSMAAISTNNLSTPHTPDINVFGPFVSNFPMGLMSESNMTYDHHNAMSVDWTSAYHEQQQQQLMGYQEEQQQQSSPAMPSNHSDCDESDSCAMQCPDSRCEQGVACNNKDCAESPCLSSFSDCDDPECEGDVCSEPDCLALDGPSLKAAESLISLPSRPAQSLSQPPSQPFSGQGTPHGLSAHLTMQSVNLGGLSETPNYNMAHGDFSCSSSARYDIPSDGLPMPNLYASQVYTNGSIDLNDLNDLNNNMENLNQFIIHALEHHAPGHHPDRCPGPCYDTVNGLKSKLERHMQTHTGYKPVKCEVCQAALSAKQSLAQHMRIHTGEKPWKCDFPGCKQSFKQQSALTMHKRTHTGEKPLSCEICGKKFGESSNLSKHRKTHNVKGQFTCEVCGKDFHRLDQMRRHMRVHDNKDKDTQHGNGSTGRVISGRVEKNTK